MNLWKENIENGCPKENNGGINGFYKTKIVHLTNDHINI